MVKHILLAIVAIVAIAGVTACGNKAKKVEKPETTTPQRGLDDKRVLILYFTHHGGTYTPDGIVNQTEGNTELMAKKIAEYIGKGDLFRIEAVKAYPEDYQKCCDVAKVELEKKELPELKAVVEKMEDYDVIFIGYPIWWGTYPRPVATFIDQKNQEFNGKTVVPFSTNEGSDWGESLTDLKAALPGSKFLPGLALRGSKVKESDDEIHRWLDQIK